MASRGKPAKKEPEQQTYQRRKEAEKLKEELLARQKEEAEREKKREEKRAERRAQAEKLAQQNRIEQAKILLNEGKKKKGNTASRASSYTKSTSKTPSPTSKNTKQNSHDASSAFDDGIWDDGPTTASSGLVNGSWNGGSGYSSNHSSSFNASSKPNGNQGANRKQDWLNPTDNHQRRPKSSQGCVPKYGNKERGRSSTRENYQTKSQNGGFKKPRERASKSESREENVWVYRQKPNLVEAPPPEINVWEERKAHQVLIEEMCPHSEREEEAMLRKAMELSRRQAIEDEKLREAYRAYQDVVDVGACGGGGGDDMWVESFQDGDFDYSDYDVSKGQSRDNTEETDVTDSSADGDEDGVWGDLPTDPKPVESNSHGDDCGERDVKTVQQEYTEDVGEDESCSESEEGEDFDDHESTEVNTVSDCDSLKGSIEPRGKDPHPGDNWEFYKPPTKASAFSGKSKPAFYCNSGDGNEPLNLSRTGFSSDSGRGVVQGTDVPSSKQSGGSPCIDRLDRANVNSKAAPIQEEEDGMGNSAQKFERKDAYLAPHAGYKTYETADDDWDGAIVDETNVFIEPPKMPVKPCTVPKVIDQDLTKSLDDMQLREIPLKNLVSSSSPSKDFTSVNATIKNVRNYESSKEISAVSAEDSMNSVKEWLAESSAHMKSQDRYNSIESSLSSDGNANRSCITDVRTDNYSNLPGASISSATNELPTSSDSYVYSQGVKSVPSFHEPHNPDSFIRNKPAESQADINPHYVQYPGDVPNPYAQSYGYANQPSYVAPPAVGLSANPMMMQQMLLFSHPFFMQQLNMLQAYCNAAGQPSALGMPGMLPTANPLVQVPQTVPQAACQPSYYSPGNINMPSQVAAGFGSQTNFDGIPSARPLVAGSKNEMEANFQGCPYVPSFRSHPPGFGSELGASACDEGNDEDVVQIPPPVPCTVNRHHYNNESSESAVRRPKHKFTDLYSAHRP